MKGAVDILGTKYKLEHHKKDSDVKLAEASGYTELFSKKLVVEDIEVDADTFENIEDYEKKVLRHEIVHAFLYESGLYSNSEYACNEELVDWIAIQGIKLYEAWKQAGAI